MQSYQKAGYTKQKEMGWNIEAEMISFLEGIDVGGSAWTRMISFLTTMVWFGLVWLIQVGYVSYVPGYAQFHGTI